MNIEPHGSRAERDPIDGGPRLRLARAIGDAYELGQLLGRGGHGVVYAAREVRLDREVAIKVLRQDIPATSELIRRFELEARSAARLRHPNVVPIYSVGEGEGLVYMVMPRIRGESLQDRLAREGRLSLSDALRIGAEIADALQSAHAIGVVHRDVKPANILLEGEGGRALLTDFGIARATEAATSSLTGTGLFVGSPHYSSPEQLTGETTLDHRSDIYSLGCVLFEALTGDPPFPGRNVQAVVARHLGEEVPSLALRRPDLPHDVCAIIEKQLRKIPGERYRTAGALAKELDRVRHVRRAAGVPWGRGQELADLPNTGRMVSWLCDRWKQVNEFDTFVRKAWSTAPGKPQVYFVHGEEGNGHSSLVDRLAHTRVKDLVAGLHEDRGGQMVRVAAPWPSGRDIENMTRHLAISLFRELAPEYLGDRLTARDLLALPALSRASVVLVEHDLRRWDPTTVELLRWYLDDFLGSVNPDHGPVQLLVFAKIIRPAASRRSLGGWLERRTRRRLKCDLAMLAEQTQCPSTVLAELEPVGIEDVKDWFVKNRIYESEEKQRSLAEAILGGLARRPLSAVESALEEIHRSFLMERASKMGELL